MDISLVKGPSSHRGFACHAEESELHSVKSGHGEVLDEGYDPALGGGSNK